MAYEMKPLLRKIHTPVWIFLILTSVFLLRIPSFFEPYSYGDEMIYLTLGNGVRQGLTLYKDIHDNKPPLLYYTAAVAGSLFWFKVILAFWSLGTVFVFWKLTAMLFPGKPKLQKLSVFFFAVLTTLPLLEGNIANAELFLIGPTILAFFLLLRHKSDLHTFLAGVLFSVSFLFKVPGIFDMGAIILFWLVTTDHLKKSFFQLSRKTIILVLGFAIPVVVTLIWYYFHNALGDYIHAAFLQNVGYLSSFRPGDVQQPFVIRNAPLIFRSFIVILGALILYLNNKRLSKTFIFSVLWILTSLFAATLSERPYPHYLIQVVPALSFLLAMLFGLESIEQSLVIIPLALVFAVPVYFKFYHYSTVNYYSRFLKFATGQTTKAQYFSQFDQNVNRNYAVSNFILTSSTPGSKLFVWGDSPPIYALTRKLPPIKYVAQYHINDFSNQHDVSITLSQNEPEYIVVLPEGGPFVDLNKILINNYFPVNSIEGTAIWHIRAKNVTIPR